jgi:Spy/CpxP family protein refolding chaperone
MRTTLSILAGLAIAGLTFSPLFAADAKTKSAGFADNLDTLNTAVTLTDEQKTKLTAIKETCAKDLEKYDKSNEARLTTAQAKLDKATQAKDDKAVKDIKAAMDTIKTVREALQAANDKKLFALLTPAQRVKWNAPILKTEIDKEFSMTFLDAKQEDRIAALCAAQAKSLTMPLDPEKLGKSLDPLKAQVLSTILTPKQQADYRKSKAPITPDKTAHQH